MWPRVKARVRRLGILSIVVVARMGRPILVSPRNTRAFLRARAHALIAMLMMIKLARSHVRVLIILSPFVLHLTPGSSHSFPSLIFPIKYVSYKVR